MEFSRAAFMIAAAVISTAPAATAMWSVWTASSNPRKLLELHGEIRPESAPNGPLRASWKGYALLILSTIGYGVFIFGGVRASLFWMPESWGTHDEDGEWSPYKLSLSMAFAVVGALAFTSMLGDYCRLNFQDQERREKRRAGRTSELK